MSLGNRFTAHARIFRHSGFTLIELLALSAVVGLVAAVTVPHMVHARSFKEQNSCINNLRKIDFAKETWAIDYHKTPDAIPSLENVEMYLSHYRQIKLPFCPLDADANFSSSYLINGLTTAPACRINSTNHVLM